MIAVHLTISIFVGVYVGRLQGAGKGGSKKKDDARAVAVEESTIVEGSAGSDGGKVHVKKNKRKVLGHIFFKTAKKNNDYLLAYTC